MKHYVLSIICYLLVTNSYAEEEACISNGFTTTCSKVKRSKEIESAYDNVINFFKIGNSNIKIAKKIYDKQLTPNESSIHSYDSEINKISQLQNNINWRKYLNELENYCTTELKNIYDNDVLDRDLAEKANKVYSFSLFKQSGQMDTEFYEIKGEQDSRNIKRCKQLARNELNLQKPIY